MSRRVDRQRTGLSREVQPWLRWGSGILIFWMILLAAVSALGAGTPDALAGDPRLGHRVQVVAEGIPVGELLPLLVEKTGTSLSAATDIADEKVIVFGPPRPLRDLLTDLAALFNTRWERKQSADGGTRYLLQRGAVATAYDQRLLRATTERMMALMEAQVRDIDKLRMPNPVPDLPGVMLRDYRPEYRRFALVLYAQLGPRQRDALFARKRFAVPFAALTPQQQEPIRAAFAKLAKEQESWRQERSRDAPGQPLPVVARPEDLERGTLRFSMVTKGTATQLRVNIGTPDDGLLGAQIDDRDLWLLPAHGNPFTDTKSSEEAPLPSPSVLLAAAREKQWIDRLRVLSETGNVAIVADYYRFKKPLAPREGSRPAAETTPAALDAFCEPEGYLWWMREKTLFLRRRDWYRHRLYEPPDRWLTATTQRLRSRGEQLTYDDVLTLQQLTPAQIHGLNNMGVNFEEEHNLADLLALLGIVGASPRNHDLPLPPWGLPASLAERSLVQYSSLTLNQRELLAAFLSLHDEPIAPALVDKFRAYMFRNDSKPRLRAFGSSTYQYLLISIGWGLDSERSWTYRVSLPLSLPDDRRDHTRVAALD